MQNTPKIITAIPHTDYTLDIELSNHRHIALDMRPFLTAPVYRKLSNLGFFLSVKHNAHMIFWDDMHDMHIDQILHFGKLEKHATT